MPYMWYMCKPFRALGSTWVRLHESPGRGKRTYMHRPREAKKLLANLLAAPGHVTVSDSAIRVMLLCAANVAERKSIDAFLRRVTAWRLPFPATPPPVRWPSDPKNHLCGWNELWCSSSRPTPV